MDSFRIDDARDRDDLVAPHNEGPRLALRAGDLRVDEHVLDLLAPPGAAVGLRLLAPELQERTDDAVLALGLDPAGDAARYEPVEDGFDLVARGVPGRAQAIREEGVADPPQLVLGPPSAPVDHDRAES